MATKKKAKKADKVVACNDAMSTLVGADPPWRSIDVTIHEESEEDWTKKYAIVGVEISVFDEEEFFDWDEMRDSFVEWVVATIGMKDRKDLSVRLFDRVVTGRWREGDYALLVHGPGGHIGEIEFYRMDGEDAKLFRKKHKRSER